MTVRLLLLASALFALCGCDSEPKVFSELMVTSDHFIYPNAYPQLTKSQFRRRVHTVARSVSYPFVLTSALKNEEVAALKSVREAEDPENWLGEQLQVTIVADAAHSGLIRIAISNDVPPEDAVILVNAVTAAFEREVIDAERQQRLSEMEELRGQIRAEENTLLQLQQELSRREKEVSAANKEMADLMFQAHNGVASTLRKHLGEIEWEILSDEIELQQLQADSQDESSEAEDVGSQIVSAKKSLAKQRMMRARILEELEARQVEVRDLGSLWVDQDLQAEKVARQKERLDELLRLEYERSVELQLLEENPPVTVIHQASAVKSGWGPPSYPLREDARTGLRQETVLGNVAIGVPVALGGVVIGFIVGRCRRRDSGRGCE